jgi:glyoxylase-like metal-dependent hydrolase (beta-lactamase superfamily II)
MKKISSSVYIEDSYPGVTVGAILFDEGVLLIDAPLRPDDGREWLSTVRDEQNGTDRTLVYLDSHPDRTLGGRALESTIIAHEAVGKVFEDRPSIFKAQVPESGTAWETCTGLSGIRWAAPNLAFVTHLQLHTGDAQIILEHHPGPEDGAAWVVAPESGVVFVGDLVTVKQPPFLSMANLEAWDLSLELLSSPAYKDYTMISSREGKINEKSIKEMRKFLGGVHKQLEKMARRKSSEENVEKMIDKLLGSFDFSARYRNQYYQRLLYGLKHCYANRYLTPK